MTSSFLNLRSRERSLGNQLQGDEKLTLSEYERIALRGRINLSDGHARLPLVPQQRQILSRALEFHDQASARCQGSIEEDFVEAFFQCARENIDDSCGLFLTFSASSAIKIVAQFCRLNGMSVLLLEPCFDNIHHLLCTEGLEVIPVKEEALFDLDRLRLVLDRKVVIWLVQPNNPTGFCLRERDFRELASVVSEKGATIVLDFCFRFFCEELLSWSQYEVLRRSGASFIAFEDTGKTWSLSDLKVGITVCSPECSSLLYRLHDELILNVSPLNLLILEAAIRDTLVAGLDVRLGIPIQNNRKLVHALIGQGLVDHGTKHCHNVPMELLALPVDVHCQLLWKMLRRRGVDILPAENYYWSNRKEGERLFRIPLSRPRKVLRVAVEIIGNTLKSLRGEE